MRTCGIAADKSHCGAQNPTPLPTTASSEGFKVPLSGRLWQSCALLQVSLSRMVFQ